MKSLVIVLVMLLSCVTFAKGSFGGSRSSSFSSGRSFSAPSRSYSAPSRSYSAPSPSYSRGGSFGGSQSTFRAPIVRPQAPAPTSKNMGQNQAPVQTGQVTHNYYGGGGYNGGSGMGFWHGMLLGQLFNHGTTVVAPQAGVPYDNGWGGGTYGGGIGYGFAVIIGILVLIAIIIFMVVK